MLFFAHSTGNFAVRGNRLSYKAVPIEDVLQLISGRGAAGSAPGLGPGGRTFESCRPDKEINTHRVLIFSFKLLRKFSSLFPPKLAQLG